ncbi:MAG: hypothetical protein A3F72_13800 [Bacteroidetes bacterium RIFCSPLOWO2_12_FULL_35_15]|nr:MAG: hypothetical protein A3F72_13800 [Bacteroidetes bacterium RIFCSPLOWO2_12_FULL_35_15]
MKVIRIFKLLLSILKLKFHHVNFNRKIRENGTYIYNKGKITIGKNVHLHSFPDGSCHKTALATYFTDAMIVIGDNCNLNGTAIHCNEKIIIGNKCMFGPGTIIVDNDSHRVVIDNLERNQKPISKPIEICDNVWIGMNTIILKGVTIGENSIVAAGSIVLKDIPPNSLYGGHPAVFLKKLN